MKTIIIFNNDNGTPFKETEEVDFALSIGSSIVNTDYIDSSNETGLFVITEVGFEKTSTGYISKAHAHAVSPDILDKALTEVHEFFTS